MKKLTSVFLSEKCPGLILLYSDLSSDPLHTLPRRHQLLLFQLKGLAIIVSYYKSSSMNVIALPPH